MMTTPPSFLILLLLVLAMTLLNGSSAGGGITSTTTTLVLDEKHPYSFLNMMTSEGLISKDQARTSAAAAGITTTTLVLEKDTSIMNMTFDEMRDMDQARHRRMLRRRTSSSSSSSSSATGTVDFPVEGDFDPYRRGFHFTRVKLGSPPREYHMKIDTSSNMMWVNCNPCTGCPTTSGLGFELGFFDPSKSSSAAVVSCSDSLCDSSCNSNSQCSYSSLGEQGSRTSGYYVSDVLYFDKLIGGSKTVSSSANVLFGCNNYHSGFATETYKAVDGVFGLGPHRRSVISQLAAHGSTPNVFSHCLKGGDMGGGTLVLGEVVEPRMIYTPLVPFQSYYYLDLLSISIGGQTVPIDPVVFATSTDRGTLVDSGTSISYLSEEAYAPFLAALVAAMPPSVKSYLENESQCFQVSSTSSARDVFPLVSLNFAGGASMILKYEDYLIQHYEFAVGVWCMGFQSNQGPIVLGESVLKDKVIVYDLARQRLGWVEFNCSLSLNVSAPPSSSSRSATLCRIVVIFCMLPFLLFCLCVV